MDIYIDNMIMKYPHYCKGDSDRVKWLALELGYVDAIRSGDTVTYLDEKECFLLHTIPPTLEHN